MLGLPPCVLLRSTVGTIIGCALLCPALWGEIPSSPNVLTSLWQRSLSAPLTGLDLTADGQIIALTTAPSASEGNSRVQVYDQLGRKVWGLDRALKMLSVSLAGTGQYAAIGSMDSSIAVFDKLGNLVWQRQSVGLPSLTFDGRHVVAFNGGMGGPGNVLLEVFREDGTIAWRFAHRGRVWRAVLSDQSDLLMGLWNNEVLFIDARRRLAWQQMLSRPIMALAISPQDGQYFAVGAGVLDPVVHLYERTGRLVWRRELPLGLTELSLARQGEFLLSYGNTVHGQHLALHGLDGQVKWLYHAETPATESSKAVIVPDAPLIVAGLQHDQHYYLEGFAFSGQPLWVAPLPEPAFDFRVSRDGRYIVVATDRAIYFFETRPAEGWKAELPK